MLLSGKVIYGKPSGGNIEHGVRVDIDQIEAEIDQELKTIKLVTRILLGIFFLGSLLLLVLSLWMHSLRTTPPGQSLPAVYTAYFVIIGTVVPLIFEGLFLLFTRNPYQVFFSSKRFEEPRLRDRTSILALLIIFFMVFCSEGLGPALLGFVVASMSDMNIWSYFLFCVSFVFFLFNFCAVGYLFDRTSRRISSLLCEPATGSNLNADLVR